MFIFQSGPGRNNGKITRYFMTKKVNSFLFISLSPVGKGLSGGDRIFIELARNISNTNFVDIYTWKQGIDMMKREQLKGDKLHIHSLHVPRILHDIFFINFFYRTYISIRWSLSLELVGDLPIVHSTSDFLMDVFPAAILKRRYPKIKWIAAYYLEAPNPFIGFREGGKLTTPEFKNIMYWLLQRPSKFLIKKLADMIFVTSEPETSRFPEHSKKNMVYVVKGGVRVEEIDLWKKKNRIGKKKYDAIFMGRFHPQKGVVELIDIWRKVVDNRPDAKLVMIGDGPLMDEVRRKVRLLKLSKNIDLKGYVLDGEQKYELFAHSRVCLHPAVYDSGGMAAAEGMIWGIPVVCFNLEALKTYYPKGVVRTKIGDIEGFAKNVLRLLSDAKLYRETSIDAESLIREEWNFKKRSERILAFINKML